ncbi:hypothetical protein FQA39_LY03716 [Lamprigera yunnana]|nr:hypothetical protein FQA39_LY03716 [Lamprigera yunnana]
MYRVYVIFKYIMMFNQIDEKYCVVQFIHPNKCRDEIFSAVPSSWLTADGCCIIKCKPPSKDWTACHEAMWGNMLALRKERKLSNYSSDSNTTESESLGRGLRIKKTKISEEHSELESDQNDESDSSITESIPSAIPDHDDFETILENGQEEIIQPVANNVNEHLEKKNERGTSHVQETRSPQNLLNNEFESDGFLKKILSKLVSIEKDVKVIKQLTKADGSTACSALLDNELFEMLSAKTIQE